MITKAKYCSLPRGYSAKSPIRLRVITIENAVIQALTISTPFSTKNGLIETVRYARWRSEGLSTETGEAQADVLRIWSRHPPETRRVFSSED